MSKSYIAASALALTLWTPIFAGPAQSFDIEPQQSSSPTLGFGLNFTFGNGVVNTGVGVRAFSDDAQDKAAM
jgi:hypothetical protein